VEEVSVQVEGFVDNVALGLELIGVLVLVVGIIWSGIRYVLVVRAEATQSAYAHFRRTIARSILLSLELLVAADIVHTVATTPSFESLGVLGLLILIRTFLSIEMEMEIDGHWPWQRTQLGTGERASGDSA
jgi:uncharacterized membrane protein